MNQRTGSLLLPTHGNQMAEFEHVWMPRSLTTASRGITTGPLLWRKLPTILQVQPFSPKLMGLHPTTASSLMTNHSYSRLSTHHLADTVSDACPQDSSAAKTSSRRRLTRSWNSASASLELLMTSASMERTSKSTTPDFTTSCKLLVNMDLCST